MTTTRNRTSAPAGTGWRPAPMTADEATAWARRARRTGQAAGDPSPPKVTIRAVAADTASGSVDVWWCDGRIVAPVAGTVQDWDPPAACRWSDGWPPVRMIGAGAES